LSPKVVYIVVEEVMGTQLNISMKKLAISLLKRE
jgi:hypothetical protein